MKMTLFMAIFLVSCSSFFLSKDDFLKMDDQELFSKAHKGKVGSCFIEDRVAKSGACDYYVKSGVKGADGDYGWPKNPKHKGGTGCLFAKDAPKKMKICWPGNDPKTMCTESFVVNGANVIRDAIQNGACDL